MQITGAVWRRVNNQTQWTPVGGNAEMAAWSAMKLDLSPFAHSATLYLTILK